MGKCNSFLDRVTILSFWLFDGFAIASIGECPLDPGGYFIVKGNEKVVKSSTANRITIVTVPTGSYFFMCRSFLYKKNYQRIILLLRPIVKEGHTLILLPYYNFLCPLSTILNFVQGSSISFVVLRV